MDAEAVEAKGIESTETTETIRPGVVIDGNTYYPPGWMYILAFALRGCQWAIDKIESGQCDALAEYYWLYGVAPAENLGASI